MPLSDPVAALLRQFHARKPVRIWSLIVTLYGDAIVPRGGSLWIGSLIEIMALFDIDAGHVRTAVSRLSSDGWLTRIKRGRASYYRLSRSGEGEFLAATERIYSGVPATEGELRAVVIGPQAQEAADLRRALKTLGYAPISPVIHAGLDPLPHELRGRAGVFVLIPEARDRELAAAAWRLDEIARGYRDFIERFAPVAAALQRQAFGEEDALVARTLLIHAFRRVVLRDPGLPSKLLPEDWSGAEARALAAGIFRALVVPSERLLDKAHNEDGPLPAPSLDLQGRFA